MFKVYFNPKFNSLIYLLYDYMTKRRQLYDQGETIIRPRGEN
jgi:hypothetical protein